MNTLSVCPECDAVEYGNLFCNTCRGVMNKTLNTKLPPWPHKAERPCGAAEVKRFMDKVERFNEAPTKGEVK